MEITQQGILVVPALVDLHVHFREPGFAYKETIRTGAEAALRSGYSDVFTMPNLNPAPDTVEHLRQQQDIILSSQQDLKQSTGRSIDIHPYASITLGQKGEGDLVDIEELSQHVHGFSDDGRGIQDEGLMREAMQRIAAADSIVVEHCEVNSLLRAGYIHDGLYARAYNHKGICSESEWREVERNIRLSQETGCRLHVCHISTLETVQLIRDAKQSGIKVTCETAPHYLLMNEGMLREDGCWKMNPPIRGVADQMALLAGILDGTIDAIPTDHAPHSMEEKSRGLEKSAFGIVGIETAFPLLYTYLVRTGLMSLDKLIDVMSTRPAAIMGLDMSGKTAQFDIETEWTIDPDKFISKGHSTPFAGWKVFGKCVNV